MHTPKILVAVAAATSLSLVLVACAAPEFPPVDPPDVVDPKVDPTSACTDGDEKPKLDPAKLPACKGTLGVRGRCVTTENFGSEAERFEAADCKGDGHCTPEELIVKGRAVELTKCNAVLNVPGRCFWTLSKEIVETYDLLKGASGTQCTEGMVCSPCVDPRTKKATGVCELGSDAPKTKCTGSKDGGAAAPPPSQVKCPYDGPPVDTSAFPQEDCGSNMVCVTTGLVPAAQQGKLKVCSKGLCAPKKSVAAAGNYVPKTCRSVADAEGRCTNLSLPDIAARGGNLPVGGECDADEACAPCFDPLTGNETGACASASCDAPKEPKKTFASCCGGRAKCVPTASVDEASQASLKRDTCAQDSLCVATEIATAPAGLVGAQACTFKGVIGFGAYQGLCVSDCFTTDLLATLKTPKQGTCPKNLACVPCENLPPGTPGCK